MDKTTRLFGFLLMLSGIAGYFHTGQESPTALIPTIIGLILFLLGIWAKNPDKRKVAMHIAVVVALLGAGGVAPRLFKGLGGGEIALRTWYMLAAFVLCVVLVLLCVRSFMTARKTSAAPQP